MIHHDNNIYYDFLPPVHGFQRPTYTVLEGESVDIVFQRNAKGQTRFARLDLRGNVTSYGDPAGGLEMLPIHTISTHTNTHVCMHTFLHFFLLLPTYNDYTHACLYKHKAL